MTSKKPNKRQTVSDDKPLTKTAKDVTSVCDSLTKLLIQKNKNYGDSAIAPLQVFSKTQAESGIKVRIDDKLSRIKNSNELRRNDVVDLMGYLVLLCVANEWEDFSDLID